MADDTAQRALDAEEHKKTYDSVMRATGEFGVPFCLALTMFFTNLVMANGIGTAVIFSVITYFAVFFIVKAFFSH